MCSLALLHSENFVSPSVTKLKVLSNSWQLCWAARRSFTLQTCETLWTKRITFELWREYFKNLGICRNCIRKMFAKMPSKKFLNYRKSSPNSGLNAFLWALNVWICVLIQKEENQRSARQLFKCNTFLSSLLSFCNKLNNCFFNSQTSSFTTISPERASFVHGSRKAPTRPSMQISRISDHRKSCALSPKGCRALKVSTLTCAKLL